MVNPAEQKPSEASVANPKTPDYIADILSGRRRRIPMSTATRKMEVAAIDGYYLYWFKESNLEAAFQAGYEFVDRGEAHLVQTGLAADKSISGNTDLGTRVSIVGSLTTGPNGGPERAYLMKLRQEWRDEDREKIDQNNAMRIGAIFKDEKIYGAEGSQREKGSLEYVKTALFNRPTRKVKNVR
jgi:hypothetical protein